MVTKGEREKYWKHLNLMYLTEESDDPENPNGIIEHKLPWRSQSKFKMFLRHHFYGMFIYPIDIDSPRTERVYGCP